MRLVTCIDTKVERVTKYSVKKAKNRLVSLFLTLLSIRFMGRGLFAGFSSFSFTVGEISCDRFL